jgi:hypothetical protein
MKVREEEVEPIKKNSIRDAIHHMLMALSN